MSEEKTRRGRSVSLSGAIGFILVALLIGMIIGGALSLFVIGPLLFGNDSGANNQNTDYQNGNNNQGPTSNPNNNNQNGYYDGPSTSPGGNNNDSNNNGQNGDGSQGMTNNNPPITNPTSQYTSTGSQFTITMPSENGGTASGTISANVNCAIQQSGNSIQLDVMITPTSVPQSLSQISNSPVTFNFAGTISGTQINAQASGSTGSGNGASFSFNLSGSLGSNTLTVTVTSASGSQLAVSTPQSITLYKS